MFYQTSILWISKTFWRRISVLKYFSLKLDIPASLNTTRLSNLGEN